MFDDRVQRSSWAGTLVLGSGVVVYDGPGASADRHCHDALQLVVGVDAPFTLCIDDESHEVAAALVPSRTEHSLAATGRTMLVLIEPAGAVGAALSRVAAGDGGFDLGDRLAGLAEPPIAEPDAVVAWSRQALGELTGLPCVVDLAAMRPEIQDLVRYVDEHLDGTPRFDEAAARVGWSPRHLRRIVEAEVAMPFRRYVLWRRLRRTVLAVRDGDDLTTAAAAAGFADSAHLSRVFRATFGLTPSEVLPLLDVAHAELDTAT